MAKTLTTRVQNLESRTGGAADGPKGARRFVVLYPGDPEPEALGPHDVILRVVYDDGPPEVHDGIETTTDAS